jgi:hypothetical protein
MNTLQHSSPEAATNERYKTPATEAGLEYSHEAATQSVMDSLPSTVPPDGNPLKRNRSLLDTTLVYILRVLHHDIPFIDTI